MTSDQMFDPTDEAIRAAFDRRARRATPGDLRRSILAATATTGQRRSWPFDPRRFLERPAGPRALAVALVSMLTVGALLSVPGGLTDAPGPRPTAPAVVADPSSKSPPPTDPTPTPAASGLPGSVLVTHFRVPFWYVPPPEPDIRHVFDRLFIKTIEAGTGAHGIAFASVTGGTFYSCPESDGSRNRFPIGDDPAAFLDTLRARARIQIEASTETTVDGYPALVTTVDPAGSVGCTYGDIFMGDDNFVQNGFPYSRGLVELDVPSRWYVFKVDGQTILIVAWGATRGDLDAWLPSANRIVESVRFAIGTPPVSPWSDTSAPAAPSSTPAAGPSTPAPSTEPAFRPVGPGQTTTLRFEQPFLYSTDDASELIVGTDTQDVFAFIDRAPVGTSAAPYGQASGFDVRRDAHGIIVMPLSSARAVGCPSRPAEPGKPPEMPEFRVTDLRTVPEDFVADLRGVAGVHPGSVASATVGGQPAIVVRLAADPDCDDAELSQGDPATGQVLRLGIPTRLYVADVPSLLIAVWAGSDTTLDAFLPKATSLVESIQFRSPL